MILSVEQFRGELFDALDRRLPNTVRRELEGIRIAYFRLQLETNVEGRWASVVRYDTAHGFAHRDLIDRRGRVQKTPLFNMDYNEALSFAESDLKANWRDYKRHFMEGGR